MRISFYYLNFVGWDVRDFVDSAGLKPRVFVLRAFSAASTASGRTSFLPGRH